ncbi:hypothetical protein SASPL_129976 [Salvia splendens]|uniref:Uncharacterized protein n=1 Tax=Salvia splendens TaxID=180675 RepID=A0A8X8X804_SALSN|nr:hypothetical protein SASPL_129976 [Salvia splendens]
MSQIAAPTPVAVKQAAALAPMRTRSVVQKSYGAQSDFSVATDAVSNEGSEAGSESLGAPSLEELIQAAGTWKSRGISIDLEAYSTFKGEEAFGVSDTDSSRSLPVTGSADLMSLDDWSVEENDEDDDLEPRRREKLGTLLSKNWETVLAETMPTRSTPMPHTDINTNTFSAFPETLNVDDGGEQDLFLFEVAEAAPQSQAPVDHNFNPFTEDLMELAAAPTFTAENPNVGSVENDPFASWADFSDQGADGAGDQQNLKDQQELLMKLVIGVCCSDRSCQAIVLWKYPEIEPHFVYSGGTLKEKRGLRNRCWSNGERGRGAGRLSIDEFADWIFSRHCCNLFNALCRDLQAYLSHLHLFLASESGNFYILVDNRPWLKDLAPLPTHWWQWMVTKSRLSPFANTRGKKERMTTEELPEPQTSSPPPTRKLRVLREWFHVIDAVVGSRKDALRPVKKLTTSLIANGLIQSSLYGFIVFEVVWSNVRGINYYNDLQTDTSLAIEAKIMRRWEFDSIAQAVWSIASWFPGTMEEHILLKEHLEVTLGEDYYDSEESFLTIIDEDGDETTSDVTLAGSETPGTLEHTPSVCPDTTESINDTHRVSPTLNEPPRRCKLFRSSHYEAKHASSSGEANSEPNGICSKTSDVSDTEEKIEVTIYRDVLILFKFSDPYLPFKLKDIIMPKLRLLTLLEAGLPSWVIFLQSYPGFCRLYRPWMCPLARGLYVLISVVTVLIGFYDLYKNVPLLKATVSRMFGPLCDWIDAWEMTSRIQYLGTMLFLHNFQKAMKWFLTATRTILSFLSFCVMPLARPFAEVLELFLPLWNLFTPVAQDFFSVISAVVESSFTMIGDILEIFLLPLHILDLFDLFLPATKFVYSVAWILFYAPFRLLLGFCRILASSSSFLYALFRDVWMSTRSIFMVTRSVQSTVSTVEISMWRSLWNDLFSQIFRALRSIFHGLVAFLAACNRHRLRSDIQFDLCIRWKFLTQDSYDSAPPWKESFYQVKKSKKDI